MGSMCPKCRDAAAGWARAASGAGNRWAAVEAEEAEEAEEAGEAGEVGVAEEAVSPARRRDVGTKHRKKFVVPRRL